jgi:hypothetical protein
MPSNYDAPRYSDNPPRPRLALAAPRHVRSLPMRAAQRPLGRPVLAQTNHGPRPAASPARRNDTYRSVNHLTREF